MTSIHQTYLERAIELGREGMRRGDGGPFGAVVVADGVILGEGWNRVLRDQDPTAHAEVNAIRAACAKLGRVHLEEATLYASCEPCPLCLAALYWAGIRAVYFAATRDDAASIGFIDARLYQELALPPGERHIPFTRLPLPQADALMAEFKAKPDKQLY